ncbi:hypothetical protein SCHPADRAFT_898403 [Schizopora paradoxa]|uniref:Arginyl-tRNA--protein transferase 1 n=1 Tax=Schizopora paradoxa TaxID=27342 RepID=A0A0H2S6B2_9AGAM|nr:hypothetical protein SCHPADRAFT_898403 [Schizopora paradoxa]
MTEQLVAIHPEGYSSNSCVYCQKSSSDSSVTVGMYPSRMSCLFYQAIIDRGWVRSGEYCYKPDMRRTCCPQYTIRLDVGEFSPSRGQRKAVHRWNRYVSLGKKNGGSAETSNGANPSKRKKTTTSSSPFSLVKSLHAAEASSVIENSTTYRFEVTIEPSSMSDEKFELYSKYQADVHRDFDQTKSKFQAFLVNSPLEYSPIPYTKEPPDYLPSNYGTYHQLYHLDGKLIAMSILDILPFCVASTYFIYDTAYERFSLGTLSALREAALVKEIQEHGAMEMKYLYMGYYVPASRKMRYKGDFSPSYLLDPEQYSWHLLKPLVPMFDKYRYVSFANPVHSLEGHDMPVLEPPPEISDDDASEIWTWYEYDDWKPLKDSVYWEEPSQELTLLRTIEYLGVDLAKKSSFMFSE